jgi:hypothetical protein
LSVEKAIVHPKAAARNPYRKIFRCSAKKSARRHDRGARRAWRDHSVQACDGSDLRGGKSAPPDAQLEFRVALWFQEEFFCGQFQDPFQFYAIAQFHATTMAEGQTIGACHGFEGLLPLRTPCGESIAPRNSDEIKIQFFLHDDYPSIWTGLAGESRLLSDN